MLKKNLLYNSILSVSQFLFPIITFPYSSRILGPHGIGAINFIDSFTQYFILFSALGIPLYGVREISKHKGDDNRLSKTFSEIFTIHLVASVIFSVVYLALALSIPNLRNHLDLVGVGIIIILSSVLSAEWLFQGMEQFAYITSRTLIVRCISVVLLFVFLRTNSPPFIYYSIMASGIVLNGFINLFYLRKLVSIKFKQLQLMQHVKPLIIILGSTVAVSVYLLMDNVILGFMKGESAVGIYATALRIVRLPLAIITAVNSVIIPQVSRAYAKQNFDEIKVLANKSFSLICVVTFPIVTGIYVASSFLIHIFAGNKFDGSILSLKILAPLIIIIGMANIVCIQLLAPMGKEGKLLKTYIVSMVFSLLTNIMLINYFSYKGACVGMIATECLATVMAYYYLRKEIVINFDKKIAVQTCIGSLLFFPIARIVRLVVSEFVIAESLIIFLCMIFYAAFLWIVVDNIYVKNLKTQLSGKYFNK